MQGTVPYLGTFLTDLTMLDAALQDHVEVSSVRVGELGLLTRRSRERESLLLVSVEGPLCVWHRVPCREEHQGG